MCLLMVVACTNKQAPKDDVAVEEATSEVMAAIVDSLDSKVPFAWNGPGKVQHVVYEGNEVHVILQVEPELLQGEMKQWVPSLCINNVHKFGQPLMEECLNKECPIVFLMYTNNPDNYDFNFKLTPSELKKRYDLVFGKK